jgi:outer membrane receptor protein involved in Fe transport
MNLFGPTAMTKEMAYYFVDTIRNKTENDLDGVAASLTGTPLQGWAGPISMAVSAEWRTLEMSLDSTSRPTDFLNCTGLRFNNCNAALPVHPNTMVPISGVSQNILEGAYEVNVPLVADWTIFKEVNFNGAARYARYDNDPNNSAVVSRTFDATTWKAGLTWDITDALTLRWTRSRDFRAPSLYDLYLPNSQGNTTNNIDYLLAAAGVPSQPRQNQGGNPLLDPEVALTSTLGIVYRPSPDFSVALDAYRIKVNDALYQLNGSSEPVQRACYASGGASPTCQLQDRALGSFTDTSPANVMTNFYIRPINIAKQEISGIDLESSWRTDLFERPFSLRALVTYQPHILYYIPFANRQDVAGVAYPAIGGLPAPVVKASLFLSYQATERLRVDLSERYRSRLEFSSDPAEREIGSVASVAYTNFSLSYDVPTPFAQLNAFVNVQNLFDKDPPPAGSLNLQFPGQFPSNYAVGDDVLGRYFTVGVRIKL